MPIVVFGLSHRSAPLSVLERVAVRGPELTKVLRRLCDSSIVDGAVVVSTCNRTDVVLDAERFHDSFEVVRQVVADHSGLAPQAFTPHLVTLYEAEAVEHLFSVAAGLESAVRGEHEILGQVRSAWEHSRAEGTVTPPLDLVFRRAVEVGKRVRTETTIGRGTASVGQAAVELAEARLGSLGGRRVAVLGAGSMGTTVARALSDRSPGELWVVNRSAERGRQLAEACGGTAAPLADLAGLMGRLDLLVTCTGASLTVVGVEQFAAAETSPVLVVDVGLPRDVDPAARHLAGVELADLDDVRRFAEIGLDQRRIAATEARSIVAEAVAEHAVERLARLAAPTVARLRGWAEEVRQGEVERYRSKLSGLTDAELAAVEALTRSVLAKLLHQPTMTLKDSAGSVRGGRLSEAAAELFGLDP